MESMHLSTNIVVPKQLQSPHFANPLPAGCAAKPIAPLPTVAFDKTGLERVAKQTQTKEAINATPYEAQLKLYMTLTKGFGAEAALAADFSTAMPVAARPKPLNVVFVNSPTVPLPSIAVAELPNRSVHFASIDIVY